MKAKEMKWIESFTVTTRTLRRVAYAHLAAMFFVFFFCRLFNRNFPEPLEHLPIVPLFALVLGQACLLGFWAVFSSVRWETRLGLLVSGIVLLEVLLTIGGDDNDFILLPTIVAGVFTAAAAGVRWRGASLRQRDHAAPLVEEGLRFSIAGLMAYTFGVAAALALAKALRPILGHAGPNVFAIGVWGICFVVIGLAAVWATLGDSRPLMRCAVVLTSATFLGGMFAYTIDERWESYFYVITITALQSITVMATLLFVRSAGYRLSGGLKSEFADSRGKATEPSCDERLKTPHL